MNNAINLGECLFTICAFCVMVYGLWRAHSPATAAAISRVVAALWASHPYHHMSSKETPAEETPAAVPSTGIGTGTAEIGEAPTNEDLPHSNAVPLSRHMEDVDIIILLASQQKGGKYRYSATKIYNLTGGNHADVLELIRQVQGKEKRNGSGTSSPTN